MAIRIEIGLPVCGLIPLEITRSSDAAHRVKYRVRYQCCGKVREMSAASIRARVSAGSATCKSCALQGNQRSVKRSAKRREPDTRLMAMMMGPGDIRPVLFSRQPLSAELIARQLARVFPSAA